ncbi:MAG: flagellar hook-associated protein 3, partial [Treponema sp.]|nr:flagellar hook-associated protein 3 [Treponema sp.]
AAHAVKYASFVSRLVRFEKNAAFAEDRYRISEGYVRQAVDIVQRVRELAVQGANGVFTKQDTGYMAAEVNELLEELASIANAQGPDGKYLFAGTEAGTQPFRLVRGFVAGAGEEQIIDVQYTGNISARDAEITQGSYAVLDQPGNEVFWAERQRIFSSRDAAEYRVLEPSVIRVDGRSIELRPGDTVHAVIAKINDSGAPVKAFLDPARNSLVMEGTFPHQIWLEEGRGGRVLTDLGILRDTDAPPPDNVSPTAQISGGSLFDAVKALRDSLYKGDVIETGGRVLGVLDAGLENLNHRVAELGARTERLAATRSRLNKEIPDVTALLAGERDLDMTEAITDLKMLEYTHQASLQTAGRLLPKTLLDFLR